MSELHPFFIWLDIYKKAFRAINKILFWGVLIKQMPETKTLQAKTFSATYITGKLFKIGLLLAVLYFVSLKDYLLFHAVTEFIGAAIAISIFLLAWNSRKFADNSFYVFIGAAFLISGMLTTLHALAFKGMNVIPGTENNANLATQLWLANQYLLAISFVAAPFFANRKLNLPVVIFFYALYFVLALVFIFQWNSFPAAYVEGQGLTDFKTFSEYFVAFLFLLSGYIFFRKKNQLDPRVVHLFYLISILFAVSTVIFTMYISVSDVLNMWGHLIRVAAMYPVYLAVVEFGLMKPYSFLFGNLKKREEALEKNEKILRAVVEDQTELICRFLPDGTLTFVNDAYCRYYGKSRESLIGKKYFENVPEDIEEGDKKHLQQLTPKNPVTEVEHRAIDKNGWQRWQHWTTRAIFGSNNDLVEYQSVGRDVTGQRYMAEALRKNEEKYRTLVDNSLVGIYRLDKNGNYTYANGAMARMFEFDSPEEMIQENVRDRYDDPSDRDSFLRTIWEKGKLSNYEAVGKTKSGRTIIVLASVTRVGDEIMGVVIDITKRRKAQAALRESEERYRIIASNTPDHILMQDKDLRYKYVINPQLGMKAGDMLGKTDFELLPKKEAENLTKIKREVMDLKKEIKLRVPLTSLEGKQEYFEGSYVPNYNAEGKVDGIIGYFKNITKRKILEDALASSNKKLSEVLSSIQDDFYVLDHDWKFIFANEQFTSKIGKRPKDIIGKNIWEMFPKHVGTTFDENLHMAMEKRETRRFEISGKYTNAWYSMTAFPSREGITIIGMDITERKKIEKAKDEFVSHASHQLRTPLASMALSSELLLRGAAGKMEPEQKEYLEEIFKSTKKMTLLVNNLLNVSRAEMGTFDVRLAPFDIMSGVKSVAKEFSPLIREKKLEMDIKIEKDMPLVKLDEKSFGIIFENLLSNAIRYTPPQGKISIRLENGEFGVLLAVSDSGCGIPEKEKKHIFEKSFRAENAKTVNSEGSGLGLYMAQIAAKRSGAKIWFESEEGKGTTFFVEFAK